MKQAIQVWLHHQGGHEADVDYDLHFFAKAGDTATLQFTAEGHKEAGMIAQLVVADQE